MPHVEVSFEAGDIVNQVMSFGATTPIDVAIQGPSLADDRAHAAKVRAELAKLPFLRDLQQAQPQDYPTLQVEVSRERAGQFGLTMQDVVRSMIPATSSSRFTDPNYWRDPASGNAFQIQVEIPQNRVQSAADLAAVPVAGAGSRPLLGEVAEIRNGTAPGLMERFNGQRIISLTANLHGITLGEAAGQVRNAIARAGQPPRGVRTTVRGQIPALDSTVEGLRSGLLIAAAAILLLLTASFQSFRLALAIVLTIPAVLCGVVLALLATGTTINIQSYMGTIMAAGIAVANSILVVSFAEQARRSDHLTPAEAARTGASGRLRAVLMTASAMIAGMIPLALGLGEGGDQTAPLGRAVIGGLLMATLATLTIVPVLYAILRSGSPGHSPSLDPTDPESSHYVAHTS
jgi:multidrug efflux pump subunit AcrB